MISASWQTPQSLLQVEKPKKNSKLKKISSSDKIVSLSDHLDADPQKEFINVLNELMSNLQKSIASKQINFVPSSNLNYTPHGQIPFPKGGVDLDDSIQQTLSKYGITCPGAESVEITHDDQDPLVTVITIKKTFF